MTTQDEHSVINIRENLADARTRLKSLKPSREISLAITKIDEAHFWLEEFERRNK